MQVTQGITAEQLITKLENDPSAADIIKHYAQRLSRRELHKFLSDSIPERFFELDRRIAMSAYVFEQQSLVRIQEALCASYHTAIKLLDVDGQREIASKFVFVLSEGSESYIEKYIEYFFRSELLALMEEKDRELVTDYLISKFLKEPSYYFIRAVTGLNGYISAHKTRAFVRAMLINYTANDDRDRRFLVGNVLASCVQDSNPQRAKIGKEAIQTSVKHQKDDDAKEGLLSIMNRPEEIPF